MGIMAYMQQVLLPQEMLAGMTAAQREYLSGIPPLITTALAIGVWGGLIGSVMLLYRNSMSFYVLVASMSGIFIQLLYTLINGTVLELLGIQGLLFPFTVLLMALILVILSRFAFFRGWMKL